MLDLPALAALEKLEKEAAPSPWEPCASLITIGRTVQGSAHGPLHRENSKNRTTADAALIAALRNAAPTLIALAREALAARHVAVVQGFLDRGECSRHALNEAHDAYIALVIANGAKHDGV